MRLKTLGALKLEGADFTRGKPLLLLCYLALEGSKERQHLAELFWLDGKDALNSLSKALYQLRQASETLIYADDVKVWTEVETDAQRFLEHVRTGNHAAALELYQGPFLQGVQRQTTSLELEEWLYSTRELLAGEARKTMIHLAETDAAGGNFDVTLERAEDAYKLSGAPSLEPAELARLYTLLRSGDSPLAARVAQEAQDFELVLTQTAEEARTILRSLRATPHNLLKPSTSFVGRELELAEVTRLFDDEDRRLVTLLGYGGAGKSRMAVQVAWRLLEQDRFRDGVYFVALDALTSPSAIPSKIMEVLEVEVGGGGATEPFTYLAEHLRDKQMLLVLDNYEHLIEGATLTTELLAACLEIKFLVTSRERLNVTEEWLAPLEGLAYPLESEGASNAASAHDTVVDYDAVRLFLQRAERAHPGFSPSENDLAAIVAICQLVAGSPLAVELAAVWVRGMTAADIADELRRNLDLLETPTRDVIDRHRSIRAAFEHSWRLLSAPEQEAYRQFAVFRGGFTREAAQEVANATSATLLSLVDKSLLRLSETGRYDRHPLLYEFAREKLSKHPEEARLVKERHASYYADFMVHRLQEEYGPDHKVIIDALEQELPNVRAAWPRMLEQQNYRQLDQVRNGLYRYHRYRGNPQESITLLRDAVPVLEGQEEARDVLGNILGLVALWYVRLGELELSKTFVEQGVEVLKHSDDPKAKAAMTNRRASLALRLGNYEDAVRYHSECLEASQHGKDRVAEAIALANLGLSYKALGEYEQAEKHVLASITLDQNLDNLEGTGSDLLILAYIYLATDRLAEAQQAFEEALDHGRQVAFQHLIAQALSGLGHCAFELGNYTRAKVLYLEAQDVLLKASSFEQGIEVEYGLSQVEIAVGLYDAAHQRLSRTLTRAYKSGILPTIFDGLLVFAELYSKVGDNDLSKIALNFVGGHSKVDAPMLARAKKLLERSQKMLPNLESDEPSSPDERLTLDDVMQRVLEASLKLRA